MKPLAKPLLWLGGAMVIGAALVMLLPHGTEPPQATLQETAADGEPISAGNPTPAMVSSMTGSDLPWMNPDAATSQATAATRVASTAKQEAQPTPGEIASKISQIRRQSDHNKREAGELLRQIDAMKASGQAPRDVNLDALRDNLLIAMRAQALAREIAELTQQADTPARRRRTEEITHELQQLQSQLRYDVGGTAAAPTTPAVLGRKQ